MLSALRRATPSSVLRPPVSRASPPSRLSLRCLSPPPPSVHPLQCLPLQSGARFFAQTSPRRTRGSPYVIERLKTVRNDPKEAREVFADIREGGGYNMTDRAASTLLRSFSKHRWVDDCVELLSYCQQRGVTPDGPSRSVAFSLLCDARKFGWAIKVFESLFEEKIERPAWLYGRAMHVAVELHRPELLTDILRHLMGDDAVVEGHQGKSAVYRTLGDVRGRGAKLSELALRALLVYADRMKQPKVALEALAMMKNDGFKPTADDYSAVFVACNFSKGWGAVVETYESMPKSFRPQLNGAAQAAVVIAHSQSESDEVKQRGLDVFGKDEAKWNTYSCNAALDALLQTRQFETLFLLANKLKQKGKRWSSRTYQIVALGYIRSGSIKKARKFMRANSMHMQNDSAECYRELIEYYTTKRNTTDACQVYKEMMQNCRMLLHSDWCSALELASQELNPTMYREFRKQMWLRDVSLNPQAPKYSFLSDERHRNNCAVLALGDRDNAAVVAPLEVSDESLAREIFEGIVQGGGSGLSKEVASKLLSTMVAHKGNTDCVTMLRYFRKYGVSLAVSTRLAAFTVLIDGHWLNEALDGVDDILEDDLILDQELYTRMIAAAAKARRNGLVVKLLRKMRQNSLKPIVSDRCNAMIKSCALEKEWDLVLDLLAMMKGEGVIPAVHTFQLVLAGCAANNSWNIIIEVYNGMPNDTQLLLSSQAVASVLMAHSRSESEELQQRTLEVCNKYKEAYKARDTKFPYEDAMVPLLEARQFASVIALADEVKDNYFDWSPTMCRRAAVAHMCSGSMDRAIQLLQDHCVEFTLEDYALALNSLCRDKCWEDVAKIYEAMPESLQSQLGGETLCSVIKAHANNGSEDRGLEIFDTHAAKWTNPACMAALEALLQTHQYDALLALADEMRRHKVGWGPFTCKMVALTNIHNGSSRKARRVLKKHAAEMGNKSVECYRELIEHFKLHHNAVEASAVAVEMMQNNAQVGVEDWQRALELAIQLPDLTPYWTLRELLRRHGGAVVQELPSSLLLQEMQRTDVR